MLLVRLSGVMDGFTHHRVGLHCVFCGFLGVAGRKVLGSLFVVHRRVVTARCCGAMEFRHLGYV